MKYTLFLTILLLLVGCQAQIGPPASRTAGILPASPPAPALPTLPVDQLLVGQTVYAEHCASCHGANLEGEANWKEQNPDGTFRAPPHTVDGHTWHHPDRQLLEAIRLGGARLPEAVGGTSLMPAFGQILTDAEIEAVLSFIKSRWPEETRAIQMEMNG